MGISQSTFHRILNSARNKLATSLIEGRPIVIVKGDTMIDPNKYLCEDCGFQWSNPEKEYEECPDCKSTNIRKLNANNRRNQMSNDACSCPNCGYSEPKLEEFHAEPKHALNAVHHFREEDYVVFKMGDDLNG